MPKFATLFDLNTLDGTNGFRIFGEADLDQAGQAVSSAGDFNGDGFADILIGAPNAWSQGMGYTGRSYIIFGKQTNFPKDYFLYELDAKDNGKTGSKFLGESAYDYSGRALSSIGDFNGDGLDDIVIAAPSAVRGGQSNAGVSYVVFGTKAKLPWAGLLSDLDGTNGFRLTGARGQQSGSHVASAGDINGDGFDDLIIAAPLSGAESLANAGASYVVFGSGSATHPDLNLSDLNGSNGFLIRGENKLDYAGQSVSSAGDFNGDGIDDLLVGAWIRGADGKQGKGATYLIYGHKGTFADVLELSSLNGTTGFQINGNMAGDNAGFSVSSAGDVNGDGKDDLLIGAPNAKSGGSGTGAAWLMFGTSDMYIKEFSLSDLNSSEAVKIIGKSNDYLGTTVTSAGDINGDGFKDILIAAHYNNNASRHNVTTAYVVFGSGTGFGSEINLANLNGTNGFQLRGQQDLNLFDNTQVSSAGDVNGDGFDDILIGEPGGKKANGVETGVTYVVYGHADRAINRSGTEKADIMTGSEYRDTLRGLGGNDRISGMGSNDTLSGGKGNDRIDGGTGSDTLYGNEDNDTFVVSSGADKIYGSSGIDTLDFVNAPSKATINLSKTSFTYPGSTSVQTFSSIENVSGSAFNDNITGNDADNVLKGGKGDDVILGAAGTDRLEGGAGADIMTGGQGADTFRFYSRTEATDKITDFDSTDFLEFRGTAFGGIKVGSLSSSLFVSRDFDHTAQDSNDRFIYQKSTDTVWFDSDGNGKTAAVLLIDFTNDFSLSYKDIYII